MCGNEIEVAGRSFLKCFHGIEASWKNFSVKGAEGGWSEEGEEHTEKFGRINIRRVNQATNIY